MAKTLGGLGWSESEDAALRLVWPAAARTDALEALPGRTWVALKARAGLLGVARPHVFSPRVGAPAWTLGELETLRRVYPVSSQADVVAALPGRTWASTNTKARDLGVLRPAFCSAPARAGPRWRAAEDAALADLWPTTPLAHVMAALPGRTADAINRRALTRGIYRHRQRDLPPATPVLAHEIWRQVPDMRGRYWVSTLGRVAGLRGLMRLTLATKTGRPVAWLSRSVRGSMTSRSVAAMVLTTFVQWMGRSHVATPRDGDLLNVTLENLVWRSRAGLSAGKSASKPARATVADGAEVHARRLCQSELWSAITTALPSTLGPDARADVTTDMVVAYLAGDLAESDFKVRAGEFVKAHNRMFGTWGQVSLDQDVRGVEGLRLGDTLSQEEYDVRWGSLNDGEPD